MFRWLIVTVLLSSPLADWGVAQSTPPAAPTDQAQSNSTLSADSATKSLAPKKVWTNENLVEAGGNVSVVGDKRNQKYIMTPGKTGRSRDGFAN